MKEEKEKPEKEKNKFGVLPVLCGCGKETSVSALISHWAGEGNASFAECDACESVTTELQKSAIKILNEGRSLDEARHTCQKERFDDMLMQSRYKVRVALALFILALIYCMHVMPG